MLPPNGLFAKARKQNGETLELVLEDGTGEERLLVPPLELAEALARLEEDPSQPFEEPALDSEIMAEEPGIPERVPRPWEPPFGSRSSETFYRAAEVEVLDSGGILLLRRLITDGPDVLEITTPGGSLYTFDYYEAYRYLRPLLPR
ncbi:MAG: hypothetical protein M1157_05305 [Deinococcus sp.]|nr:hypothetical protein [Deinococcus sp.]